MGDKKKSFDVKAIAERQALIEAIFIDYEQTREVREKLSLLLEKGRVMRKQSKRVQARVSLIEAESSCGKSSTVDDFVQSRKKANEHDILSISIPPDCTVKHMSIEFLTGLKDPLASRASSTLASNTRRIVSAIINRGISLIIIDEFQDLMSAGNERQAQVSALWVKRVLDEAKVPVVCVGYPSMGKVIKAVPGLESRTGVTITLHPLPWDTNHDEGTFVFRGFLDAFEKAMPFADRSNLQSPHIAHAIHIASGGYVGQVTKLLNVATEVSMLRTSGVDNLAVADLAEAFEALHPELENPFHVKPSRTNA